MRRVIVTGAADGIGWATAQRLAGAGWRVALLDLDAGAATRRAESLGAVHAGLGCDVSDERQVALAVDTLVRDWGGIDGLVNNAGIGEQPGATVAQDVAAFDRVLSVHLRGSFLCSRAVAPAMLAQRRGAIVNLGSIAGWAGIPGRNAYSAAKAGIVGMTRAQACEWARGGVRVNAVAPGYVRTALVDKLGREGALDVAALARRTPLGRLADPGEIAAAIAFLLSDEASFITGACLQADGGWLALGAPEAVLDAGPQQTDPPTQRT